MTFAEALAGAGDLDLHPTIRSKYVDLLIGNTCCCPYCSHGHYGWLWFECTLFNAFNVCLLAVLFVDVGNNHSVLETLAHSFVR